MHCTHGPIQVPLTQLSPLSQTCLSCPNSVPPTPFSPRSFLYRHFYLPKPCRSTSPNPLHFTSLFPWQSAGGVLFCFLACGGVERGVRHNPSVARTFWRWCGRRDTVQFGLVGVEFGHGSFALLRNTMGPRFLKETLPLTAIIIRRGALDPFE